MNLPALSPPIPFSALVPEIILAVAACVVLVLAQGRHAAQRRGLLPGITLGAIALALLALRGPDVLGWETYVRVGGSGLFYDQMAQFVRVSALILGFIIVLASWYQARDEERGEFFSMLLLSICGLMLVGPASDLVILFLALELVSIPTYIMVVLGRSGPRALEAGTKYFYLGALSAAITAYGFSFLYGVAGSADMHALSIDRIAAALRSPGTVEYTLATAGIVISILGVCFKIAAVPLHLYIADVYQGASAPVAGLLGFVPKLAGFAAIIRIVTLTDWSTYAGGLFWLLWIVAALSMTIGNVLALRQNSVKRMLAYSGVAHSGYMLVGILAGPSAGEGILGDGAAGVLYYIVIYGIANLGAFTLLAILRIRGAACESVADLAGLLRRAPGPALMMALSMLTLMGLPPTAGFWGKMSLFGSALAATDQTPAETQSWLVALVVIAVLNSAIAAAYYLRVIAAVLLAESDEPAEVAPREAQYWGALLCGFLLLFFSAYPNALFGQGRMASADIRSRIVQAPERPIRAAAVEPPASSEPGP